MSFKDEQCLKQIEWWKIYSNQTNWDDVKNKIKWGIQNKVSYPHIVKGNWHELLWKGIKEELPPYLGKKNSATLWSSQFNEFMDHMC